jgi:hypothetical protein
MLSLHHEGECPGRHKYDGCLWGIFTLFLSNHFRISLVYHFSRYCDLAPSPHVSYLCYRNYLMERYKSESLFDPKGFFE